MADSYNRNYRSRPCVRHMLAGRYGLGVLFLLGFPACLLSWAVCRAAPAALVLSNGHVYTAAAGQPRAAAVVIVGDRITFVGAAADALRRAPQARHIELRGATVLPGLTDAHAHLEEIGERELTFNLEGTQSLQELQSKLRARAAQGRPGEWLFGRGWIESRWTPP